VAARGGFPVTENELLTLPGIGPYTAGAIAALAFGERTAAVDGNAERVFSRLLATREDWAAAKRRIGAIARDLVPATRPGDFAEALMDLGSGVCTPRQPSCGLCPITAYCAAYAEGLPDRYPVKPAKTARPVRYGVAYVLRRNADVWLIRRPPSGLLGGMLALPSSDWTETRTGCDPPVEAGWANIGEVRHVFTHFALHLAVHVADARREQLPEGYWAPAADLAGLPTVFAKAASLAGLSARQRH
jgi:A/G-specific adenine glycosylase